MRTLGLIAIGGLGIGIASLSLAYALGGRDLHRLPFDFVFLLPLVAGLMLFTLIAGIVTIVLCVAGLVLLAKLFSWEGLFVFKSITRILYGVGLLGVGIGGGALLLMMVDYVVRLLGRYARLHYVLLNKASPAN